MFEYMTAQEAAELWGISVRRVQRLCKRKSNRGSIKCKSGMAYSERYKETFRQAEKI